MHRTFYLFILFLVLLITPAIVLAQGEDCSKENVEACSVDLNLFCQRVSGDVPLNFRLNPDTFDIDFTATFPKKPEVKRFPLYFVDGEVESGNVNETRVTTLNCNGNVCSGALTVEKAQKLETQFDFDQATITVLLRKLNKIGKDLCIGKFTNNPDLVAENNSGVKQICSLETTEGNELVTGSGFFTPGGFGTEGEARFHLALEGLETGTQYKLCSVIGENRYKKVASFRPVLLETASDEEIYGTLSPREQAEFNANKFLFSYELRRDVQNSVSSLLSGRNLLFTPSLSLINKGVSSTTSQSSVRQGNRRDKDRRRARRRRKKNKSKRSLSTSSVLFAADVNSSAKGGKVRQEVLSFLNFDPLGGTVVISTSCAKKVLERSVGNLVCGNDGEDDFRRCRFFSFSDEDLSASACREIKDGIGQLTIRVRNDEPLDLTVCLNGSPLDDTLPVVLGTEAGDPDVPFAELKLTDNATLLAGDPTFTELSFPVDDVDNVTLSSSGDCADGLATVAF